MEIGAVLYFQDISMSDFAVESLKKSLYLLAELCGGAMKRAVIVSTKWDRLKNRSEGHDRLTQLQQEFWKVVLTGGASECHDKPLWTVISALLQDPVDTGPIRLQVDAVRQKLAERQTEEFTEQTQGRTERTDSRRMLEILKIFFRRLRMNNRWERGYADGDEVTPPKGRRSDRAIL